MKRRSFLASSAIAAIGINTFFVTGCESKSNDKNTSASGEEFNLSFELDEESIASLQSKLKSGTFTSEQLVRLYLNRIEEIDKKGPKLNSVIEVNPDALTIAKQLDEELKAGKTRGAMHGIPVLIKDNIDTADKMQTTAGSLAMAGNIASNDASVVKKLRDAGAVIIGKTNLSEWANFRSTQSSSGWSSRGGQTKSPYFLDHNPCGSSAGSGTAVSANLCVVAVGTETDGSIVCPASVNGIVGIKPTVGLVSRSGIIPISKTQDTAGPMARTVSDAAVLLGVLASVDQKDPVTLQSKGKSVTDFSSFLKLEGLKGKRIGIENKPQGENQYINALFEDAIQLLQKQGATVVKIDYIEKINSLGQAEFEVLQYEFKDGLNQYLATANAKVKTLKDVIDFNSKNEDKAMPYFKQETLLSSNAKKDLKASEYQNSLEKSFEGSKKILNEVMAQYSLDAICGITMGPSCSIDTIYGDRWGTYSLTSPAAMSGYPHITVPCGQVYELPVGLSFFGKPYTEGLLISLGYAYEQATKKRAVPQYKVSFLS